MKHHNTYFSLICLRHRMLKITLLSASLVLISAILLAPPNSYAQSANQARAAAQSGPSIALAGSLGGKALVVINNEAPRTMAVGQEYQGIKLLSMQGNQATFQVPTADNGTRRLTLRIGQTPIHLESSSGGSIPTVQEIVLTAGRGGHYYTTGYINSKQTNFMLDTGATSIAMGSDEANRLGISLEGGRPVAMSTANGMVRGYQVRLNSVRIQDVEVFDVEATISEVPMPYILLGNSFLNRFDMNRTHDRLVLRRRY